MSRMMIGLLVLFLAVAGCGIPYRGTMYTDEVLFSLYEPQIRKGKTTEQEIREWFGDPWMVTKDLQGRPQLVYLFRGGELRMDVVLKDGIVLEHEVIRHGGEGNPEDEGTIRIR